MKLLLDENLPHQLRLEISGHEVATASYIGWGGIENGALLKRAADAGFDALITNDRGLEHEQNLGALPIAVVVLMTRSNNIEAIRRLYSQLEERLQQLRPCELVKVGA